MPLQPLPERCWIVTAEHCGGETEDRHADELEVFLPIVAEVWARFPNQDPPMPWQHDGPCLLVVCRGCARAVGDGDHFADAEHAWAAAEEDGWLRDVCPVCQVPPQPAL